MININLSGAILTIDDSGLEIFISSYLDQQRANGFTSHQAVCILLGALDIEFVADTWVGAVTHLRSRLMRFSSKRNFCDG